ncbi:50S ribosomal protein L11 methyltransferase [bacterium]|nr:MAG: 50S ribosomal protein L11 methyltransferase [bacterium]
MNQYLELKINITDKNSSHAYNILYKNGITSILEDNNSLIIDLPANQKNLLDFIIKELKEKGFKKNDINRNVLNNKNWNKEWEKTIDPIFIKNRIIIYPSWKKKSLSKYKDRILIQIDPKMSFGTGHNETTQLVLDMMCDYFDTKDKYMLDYGSGTGILSIAAVKMGVSKVVALELDEDSINNSKENFNINNASKTIKIYQKNINSIRERGFDIICANIISSVIIDNFHYINASLKSGGKLFLSGILSEEKAKISKVIKSNKFNITEIREKAEWLGIFAIKK